MNRLLGFKRHKLDSKGRVSIPANMRKDLGEVFVASRGFGEYITLFSEEAWDGFMDKIAQVPDVDERNILQMYFGANAEPMSLDGQGRILLNEENRRFAKLQGETEAIVYGNTDRIEIWNCGMFMNKLGSISYSDVSSLLKKNEI